jgi:Virulence activator alpha C-term
MNDGLRPGTVGSMRLSDTELAVLGPLSFGERSGYELSGVARDGLSLKLLFGSLADAAALRRQVEERRRRAETQLLELEEIERRIDRDADFFPYLTLLHGLETARSTMAWCDRALAELEAREAARA